MANPIKGEVPLEAGGKTYTFVLGTYALAALERRRGRAQNELRDAADWARTRAAHTRAMSVAATHS